MLYAIRGQNQNTKAKYAAVNASPRGACAADGGLRFIVTRVINRIGRGRNDDRLLLLVQN